MAQHDYVIANASGATVRADINSMALAISSNNSGSSEPATKYAYEFWVDSGNNLIKLRNGANNAWITLPLSTTASNTVDVNGGTIDGTTIGASSASTIVGTTIVANTSVNIAGDGATVTGIKDEDNMASNSAVKLATQQSIKAYVDAQVDTADSLAEILAIGNTTTTTQKIQFRDSGLYINSSADGQLDIVADTEIQIAATTIDVNGAMDISGALDVTGNTTIGLNDNEESYLRVRYSSVPTYYSSSYDGSSGLGTISINGWNNSDGSSSWSAWDNTGYTAAAIQLTSTGTGSTVLFHTATAANTDPTERMRIDASGNLLVGKTSTSYSVEGIAFRADNAGVLSTVTNEACFTANRLSSDGRLILFAKDTVTVGSIGVDGGSMAIGGGDVGIGFYQGADALVPYNGITAVRDNAIDLGMSSARYKNLYLSGGVIFDAVSGSATSNTLDDYEEGTWTGVITTTGTDFTTSSRGSDCKYTKIGDTVTAWFSVSIASPTNGTGDLKLTGLPFTSLSGNTTYRTGTIDWGRTDNVASLQVNGYLAGNATEITFTSLRDANTSLAFPASNLNGQVTPYFTGRITYKTA